MAQPFSGRFAAYLACSVLAVCRVCRFQNVTIPPFFPGADSLLETLPASLILSHTFKKARRGA